MVLRKSTYNIFLLMFVSPKHSQFKKKMRKPKHLRSCSLISIQFLPLSCIMTPCRTEKVDFSKKIIIKKNRITKKTDRQEESPEETKKTRKKNHKNQKQTKKIKKRQNLHFPQFFFVFLVFFLGFGFLVCFFWLLCFFFIFFSVKPYILCVVGLITLATQDFPSLI